MSTTNDVEHVLQKLRTDYPSTSGREAVHLWNKTIDALVGLGKSAVMPLIMGLGDRDRAVRKAAAQALGKLADDRAVEPLIMALQERNRSVRRAAAEALGQLGFPHARESLTRLLHDEDAQVRTSAAYALIKNGWQPAEKAQRALLVETLEAVLQNTNPRTRLEAVLALGIIDEDPGGLRKGGDPHIINALLLALQDKDVLVRNAATEALAAYGAATLEPLLALLGKGISTRSVIFTLGKIGDARTVEPLLAVLQNGDQRTRVYAIESLGQIGDPRAIESLLASLQNVDPEVRRVAVDALGNMRDPRLIEPLLSMLQDPLFSIRQRSARILARQGWHPVDQAQQVLLIVAKGDWEQAIRRGAATVGPLLTLRYDPEVADKVVQALSALLEQHAASIPTEDLHTMTMLSGLQYFRRPDNWGEEESPLDCTHLQQRARELLAERQKEQG